MKKAMVLLCVLMAGTLAWGQDSDNDGVPDKLDKMPHVAGYYHGSSAEPANPTGEEPSVDTDRDGVPDYLDRVPYAAGYYHSLVMAVVEKPKLDSDGDGVTDDLDKCPGTPAGVVVDMAGCPLDSDGDGVPDNVDKCPGTPAGQQVDALGCSLDGDGDGVVDADDKCPGTPAGAAVDMAGCPLDSDGDGVADYLDQCPGTAKGIPVDETGCPVLIKKGEKITLDINFASNSAEFDEPSREKIENVGKTLLEFGEINVAIKGFTDNTGSETYNRELSDKRAKAVMAYLSNMGVEESRMTARGYGEDPQYFVGDNNTPEGRAMNRRVEIESVE